LSYPSHLSGLVVLYQLGYDCEVAALRQVISIIHLIGDSFNITDTGGLTWFMAGYSLTVGAFILFSGRLGDVYGYKRVLLRGIAW
jgi:MFS family permease